MSPICVEDLEQLVIKQSGGKVSVGVDTAVGRYLVAQELLEQHTAVLTEDSLLMGTDEARFLKKVATKGHAEAMIEAWDRPDAGGSNPLAHVDLFGCFVRTRMDVESADNAAASGAAQCLRRLKSWFCRPEEQWVDHEAQAEKLQMVHGALRANLRQIVDIADLKLLDDVLSRNAEEFTGAPAIFGSSADRPSCFSRRRFQGIFPCKDLIEHSCVPNCLTLSGPKHTVSIQSLPGATAEHLVMQVFPLQAVHPREHLSWSYLPYWKTLWPTQLRRQALKEGWDFVCQCTRCAGGTREEVMAFVCPKCGQGDLCPAGPCVASDTEQLSGCAGVKHAAALMAVSTLQCSCGLSLQHGDSNGQYGGYLEKCIAQEAELFALPWKGVFGRDLAQHVESGGTHLLADTHWLLADHASHVLENAPAILEAKSLTQPGTDVNAVNLELSRMACAVDTLVAALRRLHGHDCQVALPELLLMKALCTGRKKDFDKCLDAHRHVFAKSSASQSILAAAHRLCTSPGSFILDALQLGPGAAERLWMQLAASEGLGECELRQDALTSDLLQVEIARVETWVGAEAALCQRKADNELVDAGVWILRRMWLCPDLHSNTTSSRLTKNKMKGDMKRPASVAGNAVVRKRPAANRTPHGGPSTMKQRRLNSNA